MSSFRREVVVDAGDAHAGGTRDVADRRSVKPCSRKASSAASLIRSSGGALRQHARQVAQSYRGGSSCTPSSCTVCRSPDEYATTTQGWNLPRVPGVVSRIPRDEESCARTELHDLLADAVLELALEHVQRLVAVGVEVPRVLAARVDLHKDNIGVPASSRLPAPGHLMDRGRKRSPPRCSRVPRRTGRPRSPLLISNPRVGSSCPVPRRTPRRRG